MEYKIKLFKLTQICSVVKFYPLVGGIGGAVTRPSHFVDDHGHQRNSAVAVVAVDQFPAKSLAQEKMNCWNCRPKLRRWKWR